MLDNYHLEYFSGSPEIFLFFGTLFLLLVGVFVNKNYSLKVTFALVVGIIALCFYSALNFKQSSYSYNDFYYIDYLTQYSKQIILVSSLLIMIISLPFMVQDNVRSFEFPVIFLLSILGMMVVVSSNHFLLFYLGIELQSLALYVLVAYQRHKYKSGEAALKYFVLGALSSIFILYGMSFVYGFTGTLNFNGISEELKFISIDYIPLSLNIGGMLIIIGICFKLAVVPMHMWAPDVYEGSSVPVTAFISTVPKLAAITILIRLITGPFEALMNNWNIIFQFLAGASIIWGSIGALYQVRLRRLLAYSTISHMGYILMGISSGSITGMQSAFMYIIVYIITVIGVFSFILGWTFNNKYLEEIKHLSGLSKSHPIKALMFSIIMFSMAGIPPFGGFFVKLSVFSAAAEAKMYYLMLVAAFFSVVSAVYYLRIVKIIYFDPVGIGEYYWKKSNNFYKVNMVVALVSSATITLLFIIYPKLIIDCSELAITSYIRCMS